MFTTDQALAELHSKLGIKSGIELTDYLCCDEAAGGCGKVQKVTQIKKDTCCYFYSYALAHQPELAYGCTVDYSTWVAVEKPTTMLLADMDYVLGMGRIPWQMEYRKKLGGFKNGQWHGRHVVTVPLGLEKKAEWLFEEWINSEQYLMLKARQGLMAKLMLHAKMGGKVEIAGFVATYDLMTSKVEVRDAYTRDKLVAVRYISTKDMPKLRREASGR